MFCYNCGNQLGAGNAYCPNCGTKQGNNMSSKDYVRDAIRGELRGLRRLSFFLIIFMTVVWALSYFSLVLGKTTSTSNLVTRIDRATPPILSPTPFHQTVTTGTHIIKIQTGTGFDLNTHSVQGEAGTFVYGEKVYVVYTVQTHDSNAQVDLQLFQNNQLEDTSGQFA